MTAPSAKRQGINTLAFGFILIMIAIICFGLFLISQRSAPVPRIGSSAAPTQPNSTKIASVPALPFSQPTAISIPAINVESSLITVGKNPDGTIEVPGADNYNQAAWYRNSPSPGQLGSSIIEGHVDYIKKGPAIFFRLGDVKPGDVIAVDRQDSTRLNFKVDELAVYKKDEFPTDKVYGISNRPALVLITCGGAFNGMTGEYESNTVVYASLIKSS